MNIQNEIINFDANTGTILVRYFCNEFPEGLIYNIDLPVENGEFPDQSAIDNLISLMKPKGQIERIVALKNVSIPDYLIKLNPPIKVQVIEPAIIIRNQRNDLLAQSDWTQLNDAPLSDDEKNAWAIYRQELRDIPEQNGFPESVIFPISPMIEPR